MAVLPASGAAVSGMVRLSSPEQHAALRRVMEASSAPADPGADRFTYRVEVHDDNGQRAVHVPESAMPASLAAIATE